ncbi:hypothetical protein CPLU01_12012 [Colletotrichum plurivorum]|uniref:Uncharacterized protein n=1 Tax=Colletotrichum plurivorum TaxID=2175906 RepID=A0A8H6K0D7_9PEZI|nr:hypothetical protein CPLU01_12012 [Colletotrichum plurivorum]
MLPCCHAMDASAAFHAARPMSGIHHTRLRYVAKKLLPSIHLIASRPGLVTSTARTDLAPDDGGHSNTPGPFIIGAKLNTR